MLGTKAPASQGGATPGKDSAAPDPDELLSLSDILKELSNSTSTLTQDSGSGSGSGGGGSQQQSKAGVAISGAVAVNMVNDFAQAYINAAGLTITIGGDATISATNGTHALALSGAVALAQPDNAKTNVGIAGAYSMNGWAARRAPRLPWWAACWWPATWPVGPPHGRGGDAGGRHGRRQGPEGRGPGRLGRGDDGQLRQYRPCWATPPRSARAA